MHNALPEDAAYWRDRAIALEAAVEAAHEQGARANDVLRAKLADAERERDTARAELAAMRKRIAKVPVSRIKAASPHRDEGVDIMYAADVRAAVEG